MTWTLDNGTIVMQNFVNKDQVKSFSKMKALQLFNQDCTANQLEYWGSTYLDLVWNMTGTAECCYSDGCNDNRVKEINHQEMFIY